MLPPGCLLGDVFWEHAGEIIYLGWPGEASVFHLRKRELVGRGKEVWVGYAASAMPR